MWLSSSSVQGDVEAVAEGIGDGLVGRDCLIFISGIDVNSRCVSVTTRIDAFVLVIFPLRGRLPEIAVTVEDVPVVDGHHLVAGDLEHGLFNNGAAQALNHCPVGIFTIQRDSEGQASSPRNDHVMCPHIWEPDEQLLVLVDRARVVGYHDGLPHAFDPEGLTETPVRIKFTSEFARRSHGVFWTYATTSKWRHLCRFFNAAMDDVTVENPTFDPDGPDDDYSFDLPDPPPPPPWSLRRTSSSS